MKKIFWQPLLLGMGLGLLVGISMVTGFTILTSGSVTNAIGFYILPLLLSAAIGGPMAGIAASSTMMLLAAMLGSPEIKAVVTIPAVFWSNVLALGTGASLIGFGYRFLFQRLKMPVRLLPWAGLVVAFYLLSNPISLTLQYLWLGNPFSEILPAIWYSYQTFVPQAIFDIFITSLIFVVPSRYLRPVWDGNPRTAAKPVE